MHADIAPGWFGGAAIAPFPVADGTPLTGYMARQGPAVGTLDPLTVGALVLERHGERLVCVSADLAAVDAGLVQEIASAAGIARSHLALCASHTHSGPAGVVARLHPASPNELDPALRARFVATAAATIAAAWRDLQPIALVFGSTAVAGVATNRNDPAKSADQRLSVLATQRGDGSIHCAIVHFACHPTVLGADSRVVSADFPGALRRRLAELLTLDEDGEPPIVHFVNGAAGDLSTRFTRRAQDAAEVERLGGVLAEAARDALRDARSLAGPLHQGSTSVALMPRTHLAMDVEVITGPDTIMNRAGATASPGVRRIAETQAQGTAMLAALTALPQDAIATACELEAWMLDDVTLLSVPGELFASLGRQIAATAKPTLVLGYTNGYIGYLADRPAHEAGSYEALASPYGPEDGERVAAAAATLAARLRQDCAMANGSA